MKRGTLFLATAPLALATPAHAGTMADNSAAQVEPTAFTTVGAILARTASVSLRF